MNNSFSMIQKKQPKQVHQKQNISQQLLPFLVDQKKKYLNLVIKRKQPTYIKELIEQRYNFLQNEQANLNLIQNKHFSDMTKVKSNIILISKRNNQINFEKNQSNKLLRFTNKQELKQQQIQLNQQLRKINYSYELINRRKRNQSEYQECIKRIKMNTTYKGFNSKINKSINQNVNHQMVIDKTHKIGSEQKYTMQLKSKERRRMISYFLGNSPLKRKLSNNSKKQEIQEKSFLIKNFRSIPLTSLKKKTIFNPQSIIIGGDKEQSLSLIHGKEETIDPW